MRRGPRSLVVCRIPLRARADRGRVGCSVCDRLRPAWRCAHAAIAGCLREGWCLPCAATAPALTLGPWAASSLIGSSPVADDWCGAPIAQLPRSWWPVSKLGASGSAQPGGSICVRWDPWSQRASRGVDRSGLRRQVGGRHAGRRAVGGSSSSRQTGFLRRSTPSAVGARHVSLTPRPVVVPRRPTTISKPSPSPEPAMRCTPTRAR